LKKETIIKDQSRLNEVKVAH